MSPDQIVSFAIGIACGICIAVPVMLHWHVGRVRELWKAWLR